MTRQIGVNLAAVLRGAGVAFVLRVLAAVFGYVGVVLLARLTGLAGLGAYSVASSSVAALATVSGLGLGVAAVRIVPEQLAIGNEGALRVFWRRGRLLTGCASLALAIPIFFCADLIADALFENQSLGFGIRVTAFAIPMVAIGFFNAEVLRALRALFASETLRMFVPPTTTALFLAASLGVAGGDNSERIGFVALLVSSAVLFVISEWWTARRLPPEDASKPRLGYRELLRLAIPMMSSSTVAILAGRMDVVLVAIFASLSESGLYSGAYRLAVLASFVPAALNRSYAPYFAELFWRNEQRAELKKAMSWCAAVMFWTSVPVVVAMILVPSFLMGLLGPDFRQGSTILVLLVIAEAVPALGSYSGSLLNIAGKQVALMRLTLGVLALNVALCILLVPRYGATGAAAIALGCAVLRHGIAGWLLWRWFDLKSVHFPIAMPIRFVKRVAANHARRNP